MFQRVKVHIVDVILVIAFILNPVFPLASLPDTALAARALGRRQRLGLRQPPGKRELDDLPAQGKIGVAIR